MGGKVTRVSYAMEVQERFRACMVLSGVGDALGYRNGYWEFMTLGEEVHRQVRALGGVEAIRVDKENFRVSDDTVMHLATAEALVSNWASCEKPKETLYRTLARRYQESMLDMSGRAPGSTCCTYVDTLRPDQPMGYVIPFNLSGGGCGAAMRAVPIGLYFSDPSQLDDLIAVAIESGRMTHNHPTGFLGALAAALFTSYAIQQKPPVEWGAGLMEVLDKAMKYIEETRRDVESIKENWSYFYEKWESYLQMRGIHDGKSDPVFPEHFGIAERDEFYGSISFCGWGGASGHDAPMIAYDAILGAGESWCELCKRGMFHGGDSDSTGILAGAMWGAYRGFKGVPKNHHKDLEYRDRLINLADSIFQVNHHNPESQQ